MSVYHGLEGRKPRIVIVSAGVNISFGANNYTAYYSPNGRLNTSNITIRRLPLGFRGRVIRQFANIPVNTKTGGVLTSGVNIGGTDFASVLTIPLGVVGQFDSGLLATPIPFEPTDNFSTLVQHVGGTGGLIQWERIITTCEVLGI